MKSLQSFNILVVVLAIICCSCEEFVNINPPKTQVVSKTLFEDDKAATTAIVGIYSTMAQSFMVSSRLPGFSSDELLIHTQSQEVVQFFQNSLTPDNQSVNSIWSTAYKLIYYTNSVLEGVQQSSSITAQTRARLEGEAKFVRAYCHFLLTNYFGHVPYITSTDYHTNAKVSRISPEMVYQKIIEDLKAAENLLPEAYPTQGKVRPNKFAAKALLARVYLYNQNWSLAEETASEVIAQSEMYTLVPSANVFLANSQEAIWQVMPVVPDLGADDSFFILLAPPNFLFYASLNPQLVNSFEEGDLRRSNWVGSVTDGTTTFYFSHKYKVRNPTGHWPEYNMMLRLAEQYLIRAEARTQLGNTEGARQDVNTIRQRAGLPETDANDVNGLLTAIEQERRFEFLAENGHRWFDLKRTGRADEILSVAKPNWVPTAVLYPVPQLEIQNNNNLLPQNQGY